MNRTFTTPSRRFPGHSATGLSRQTASPIALSVNGLRSSADAHPSPASPPFGHSQDTNRTWSADCRPSRDRLYPCSVSVSPGRRSQEVRQADARPTTPGFLIHDSTIFDGVDERQRAEALELAASESQAQEFLYFCTRNSDYVPRNEFSAGFRIEDYIRLRLTDADVTGCLMGVRF